MQRCVVQHGFKFIRSWKTCQTLTIPATRQPKEQSRQYHCSQPHNQNEDISIKSQISAIDIEKSSEITDDGTLNNQVPWDIDFTNVVEAYRSKTNFEIFRAAMVFQLCTIGFLVEHGMTVSRLSSFVNVLFDISFI